MADAGDTVLKKDIKTQEVINRFEEKGGDYYKKAIDHFKDSKTDKGTQFIDLGTPARLTRVYEVIEHYGGELKTKNILDIGCSYGLFLHILKGLGIEASGLDQDEDFVEYGKNDGLDIRKSDITEKDIPVDERFDITTSVYVLDHISLNDQDAFLRTFNNIFDLTKDEGLSIHYLSEDKYTFFEKNLDKLESYLLDRIFVDGGVILVFRKPAQGDMTLASAEDRQVDHTFSGSGDSEATRIGSLSAGEMAQEIWREAHRFFGWGMVASGVLCLIYAPAGVIGVIIVGIGSLPFSWLRYRGKYGTGRTWHSEPGWEGYRPMAKCPACSQLTKLDNPDDLPLATCDQCNHPLT